MAVVHPCSKSAILGAVELRDEGQLDQILIGPGAKIRAAAEEAGVSLDGFLIEETEHSHAAAARAVVLAAKGEVQALVDGSLRSDELLAAMVFKTGELRAERQITGALIDGPPSRGAEAIDLFCLRITAFDAGGGSLITVSFYRAGRVVENYNLMGPVKATLEAAVRYPTANLAGERIRAFSLSTGPVKTRAASGIGRLDVLMGEVRACTPSGKLVSIEEIGALAAFQAIDAASPMSRSVIYAGDGFHTTA